jgi:hypothetical protein
MATGAALSPTQLIQVSRDLSDDPAELNGELLVGTLALHASRHMEKFDTLRRAAHHHRPPARHHAAAEDNVALVNTSLEDDNVADEAFLRAAVDATLASASSPGVEAYNVALLTTILLDRWHTSRSHEREVLAAVAVNVENPFISAVHVLLESRPGRNNCSALQNLLENASNRTLTQFGKVTCVQIFKRPVYETFVRYANASMPVGKVMVSNPDVVYDETLALLPGLVAGVGVHVLSVTPPPYEGAFKKIFGQQCVHRAERCAWVAESWDAYVFRTPLPAKLAEKHGLLSYFR